MRYWQQYGDYVLMAMPYADEVLVEGLGCTVRDADGKETLDLAAGMFCCVLGHNHPKFIERVARQTRSRRRPARSFSAVRSGGRLQARRRYSGAS